MFAMGQSMDCNSMSVLIPAPACLGVLTLNLPYAARIYPCAGKCMTFVPNASFTGTVTFTYNFEDNTGCTTSGQVSLTYRANPVGVPDTLSACQGTTLTFDVLANDTVATGATIDCNSLAVPNPPPAKIGRA